MVPLAHIMGVPVEETAGTLGPVAAVSLIGMSAALRVRWRESRLSRRFHRGERSRG
jgi:hypothetical protein